MRIRQLDLKSKFCHQLRLEVLDQVIPRATIQEVLQDCGVHAQRERKLTMEAVVWLMIFMNLFTRDSLGAVFEKMTHGLRWLWPHRQDGCVVDSALTYRRYPWGVRPLAHLFRRICQPIATPDTVGAFRFGLRLMALDAQIQEMPDTPENGAYFGRYNEPEKMGTQASPYAQLRAVYLCECGTHAIVDAGFWPCAVREHRGAARLLRSVTAEMLVMWDRGLHAYDLIEGVRQRRAHVLSRLSAVIKPVLEQPLADGTPLVWLAPHTYQRCRRGEGILVRWIEYTLDDPSRPGYQERHRLITTLLDPKAYPAKELVVTYHERWELESTLDEMQTHPLPDQSLLRSRKPLGVLQEMVGLLLAQYVVRVLMHQAACQAQTDPDRLSFTRSLRLVGEAIRDFAIVAWSLLQQFSRRLLAEVVSVRLPQRRLRSNPRVVKRRSSKFATKQPEDCLRPQPTRAFADTIVLI